MSREPDLIETLLCSAAALFLTLAVVAIYCF